jgi:hypothetical protein
MTTTSTLADQERPTVSVSAASARQPSEVGGDAANATRRDLVAMHNSLLKAIQAAQPTGRGAVPDAAIARLLPKLNDLGEAVLRIEALLAVNLRAEIQKAVREVAGPEAVMQVAMPPRRLSRLLLLSLILNLLLALAIVAQAVPELGLWFEHGLMPRLAELLAWPAMLLKGL